MRVRLCADCWVDLRSTPSSALFPVVLTHTHTPVKQERDRVMQRVCVYQ